MSVVLLALMSLAWGADASLSIERAKAAMARNWPVQGRDLAKDALEHDPTSEMAWRVYLRASVMMGVGAIAEAEIKEAAKTDPAARIAWSWWRVTQGRRSPEDLRDEADTDGGKIALAWVSYNQTASLDALALLPDLPDNEMVARLQIRANAEAGKKAKAVQIARRWLRANPDQPHVVVEIWAADRSPAIERFKRNAVKGAREQLLEHPDDALLHYRALRLFAAARIHGDSKATVDRIGALGLERPLYRTLWSSPMREGMGHVLGMKEDGTLPDGTDDELLDITLSWTDSLVKKEKFDQAEAAWTQLTDRVETAEAFLAHAQFLQEMGHDQQALVLAQRARVLAAHPKWNDQGILDLAYQALLLADIHGLIAEVGMGARNPKMARTAAAVAHGLDPQQRWATLRAGLDALPIEGADPLPEDPLVQATVDSLMAPFDGRLTAERAKALEDAQYMDAAFGGWSVAESQGADVGDATARTYPGLGELGVASEAASAAYRAARNGYGERLRALHTARDEHARPNEAAPGPGFLLPPWQAEGVQGQPLTNDDLAGEPYLLAFWASWCGPCLQELPQLNEAATDSSLNIVALSTDARLSIWQRAYRKHHWDALTHAWAPRLAATLRVEQIPTAYVVDANGRIVRVFVGYHPGGVPDMLQALRDAR